MKLPAPVQEAAQTVIEAQSSLHQMVSTAESCTGGLIASALTAVAGSSAVVDRGFVTYSNEAKNEMLGVPMPLIAEHGAVSAEVAEAMAEGALANSNAHIAVSVTGIAGPGGGSPEKPVGLVYFGLARSGAKTQTHKEVFSNSNREQVREKTVLRALELLSE